MHIHYTYKYKTNFTPPLGTLAYYNIPDGCKNVKGTFQLAMNYIFNDLIFLLLAYLNEPQFTQKNALKI